MSDSVYRVYDLVKQYPGQEQPANKHINLVIEQGEICPWSCDGSTRSSATLPDLHWPL